MYKTSEKKLHKFSVWQ